MATGYRREIADAVRELDRPRVWPDRAPRPRPAFARAAPTNSPKAPRFAPDASSPSSPPRWWRSSLVAGRRLRAAGRPVDTVAIVAIVLLNAPLGFTQEFRAESSDGGAVAPCRPRGEGAAATGSGRSPPGFVPGESFCWNGRPRPGRRPPRRGHSRTDESTPDRRIRPVEKSPIRFPIPTCPSATGGTPFIRQLPSSSTGGLPLWRLAPAGTPELGTDRADVLRGAPRGDAAPAPDGRSGRDLGVARARDRRPHLRDGAVAGEDPVLLFLTAVSFAVAAIRRGCRAVVTVTLALGSVRMLARRALIRSFPAVETPGPVTVICSDKTGTLTSNRMDVPEILSAGGRLHRRRSPRRNGAVSSRPSFRGGVRPLQRRGPPAAVGSTPLGIPTETFLLCRRPRERG